METIELFNKLRYKYIKNNAYSEALLNKGGIQEKYISVSENYNEIKKLKDIKLKAFLLTHYENLMIPLDLPDGTIIGFQVRDLNSKSFYKVKVDFNYPLFFGFQDFNDFNFGDRIFLVEGILDAMTVKLFYKYTIAYLKGSPPENLFEFVKQLTNDIVFIPDSDFTGYKLKYDEKYKGYPFYYVDKKYKDCGEYWRLSNPDNTILLNQIETFINKSSIKF